MKIKDYKCKCGHNDFFFADKGNQKGIYCSYCGKWLKWADRDEQNLIMKQESALDKIKTEIITRDRNIKAVRSDEHCFFTTEEILEIIDKYKSESELQESDIEKRKPCINYEDGCEEWAGCPCVYYKNRKRGINGSIS